MTIIMGILIIGGNVKIEPNPNLHCEVQFNV